MSLDRLMLKVQELHEFINRDILEEEPEDKEKDRLLEQYEEVVEELKYFKKKAEKLELENKSLKRELNTFKYLVKDELSLLKQQQKIIEEQKAEIALLKQQLKICQNSSPEKIQIKLEPEVELIDKKLEEKAKDVSKRFNRVVKGFKTEVVNLNYKA